MAKAAGGTGGGAAAAATTPATPPNGPSQNAHGKQAGSADGGKRKRNDEGAANQKGKRKAGRPCKAGPGRPHGGKASTGCFNYKDLIAVEWRVKSDDDPVNLYNHMWSDAGIVRYSFVCIALTRGP